MDLYSETWQIGTEEEMLSYRLSLHSDRYTCVPTVSKCEFKVVFKDQFTDQVLLSPAPHVAVSSMDDDMTTFTVPMQSSLGTLVSQIFNAPEYRGQTCEISTKLVLPASAFEADEWTNYAPPTPVELDFRFNHIYDESHHDFTIRTRGGVAYRASRAALFLCSSYFRNLFPFPNEEVVDFSYECVSTVVMFMITGTFSAPPSLTPQLTKEIVNCAERFSAINRKKLVNALAKMASNELVDHRDDIDAVVSWLLVASECEMQRLQNACSALLITIHYNQLVHDYSMAASSPALAEVRQRLHLRHGMFRPAPYTRLMQLKRGMFNVRTLMNMQSEEEISK